MTQATYYIGIDGGGTKCRARLEDQQGNLLGNAVSGSANIMRDIELAKTSILDAIHKAIAASGLSIELSQCVVGAGLAGANVPSALSQMDKWQHPFLALSTISDLHAACLGAHEGKDGAAIIIGTGSSGTRFVAGKFDDVGGHGFPIGDIGSGAWLGLHAVKHTLKAMDGLISEDELSKVVAEHFSISDPLELVQICASYTPRDFASLVLLMVPLLTRNEPVVTGLFEEATNYIQALADRLLTNNNVPLCLIGGLSELIAQRLSAKTRARLTEGAHSPEQGAIFYAKQSFAKSEAVV